MPRYSNYYAHPKKARSPRKPRAPPKNIEYEDDAEIIGLLPDDARLDLPTRTSPMKFKNGTNVFKFDFEAPLAFPRRPLGMSLQEMYKAIVDGDGDRDDKPAQTTTTKTTMPRKRQRDAEEASDGHDGDDEKEVKVKQSARDDARVTDAQEAAGTKRRKLRV
ncbi:hypothetical protein EXIGLDRAFT_842061 [Exidia glandulosa HHB12029]|uniref:Uncharacterized protein n=1 Tax=Exidia glandulosa HHB12029 TaxID=1314781 RepID=A0A165DIK0_EXIGL|nr:hypothetical protein EXIGLDRAFT_842061 [Exidia glandulosa HHB12029]